MSRGLPRSLDLSGLARIPRFRHCFRYPLHAHDFHPLREGERLRGYYAAKPLYGKLDARGHVDRSGGFDGRIAGVFIPSPARSLKHAQLFFTRMRKDRITRDGRRNWPAIHAAAERALAARRRMPGPSATRALSGRAARAAKLR
jgi:hypothetical protein